MSDIQKFLREHRNGVTVDDLGDALRDLVAAVSEEEKGGTMTITISVKPIGKGGALEVGVTHSVKAPAKPAGVSIFYASPENGLVRDDPRQTKLELREIGPSVAIKGLA